MRIMRINFSSIVIFLAPFSSVAVQPLIMEQKTNKMKKENGSPYLTEKISQDGRLEEKQNGRL